MDLKGICLVRGMLSLPAADSTLTIINSCEVPGKQLLKAFHGLFEAYCCINVYMIAYHCH